MEVFSVLDGMQRVDKGAQHSAKSLSELTEVLQLSEKLDRIENSLPSHLRISPSSGPNLLADPIAELQAEAIAIRYESSRIPKGTSHLWIPILTRSTEYFMFA